MLRGPTEPPATPVQPRLDFGRVEAEQAADLEERDAILRHEAAHEADVHAEAGGHGVKVDQRQAVWGWGGHLVAIDRRLAELMAQIKAAVAETPTGLTNLFGVGPVTTARVLGEVGDVARSRTRHHFASYNGTASVDSSSGGGPPAYRLNTKGNRKLNHAIQLVAGPPRLQDVVVDQAHTDAAPQRLGGGIDRPVTPIDEKESPGMREQVANLTEQLGPGAVGQPLVGEDQRDSFAGRVERGEQTESRTHRQGGEDPKERP